MGVHSVSRQTVDPARTDESWSVPWKRPSLSATLVSKPALHPRAIEYVEDVLRSGWWGYGPVAQHLQACVEALYAHRQNALATTSCTAAMHLALRAAGVGPGDEVIVPAFTYVSTAVVARYCGAEPVFADIDPETLTITAETVEPLLSPRTKVILPVHYAGPARDFGPIRALAAERGITVVEDAAHAFGSRRDGEPVAIDADFVAFSFAPTKQVASSGGGLLLFKDGQRRDEISQMAFLGLAIDTFGRTIARGVSPTQHVARLGHKYKLDDLAAAVALAGVEDLEAIVAHRGSLVERYYHHLQDEPAVQLLPQRTNATTSWYVMPLRVAVERRDELRAHLAMHGIDTTVHYPNLREQPAFQGCRGEVPVTARECRRVLSLPLHRSLGPDDVDRICGVVRDFLD
jgi:UDP-4-amino-4-deoxy-L-arabinose-oxoglutarate aminotransferase